MVRQLVEKNYIPIWANTIILGITAFLLINFVGEIIDNDKIADEKITRCEARINEISKDFAVLKKSVKYEIKTVNNRIDVISYQLGQQNKTMDRMHYVVEKMAKNEGIK